VDRREPSRGGSRSEAPAPAHESPSPRSRPNAAPRPNVRGIGALWTLELVRDRETKEPLVPIDATGKANAPMAAFGKACLGRGLIPLVLGNRVHVAPPLNVTDDDAAAGLAILDSALAEVDAFLA
jgi:taurine--2-oxoglutarate transaminase